MNHKIDFAYRTITKQEIHAIGNNGKRTLVSSRVLRVYSRVLQLDWLDWIVRTLIALPCGLLWGLSFGLSLLIAVLMGLIFSVRYYTIETSSE